jgi:short-subunit dehydrogenase
MEKKTLVIIGAGPGIGLAIAKKFGGEGFRIALVSRNENMLDLMVAQLSGLAIEAKSFVTDITDHSNFSKALREIKAFYKTIDVVEYSPSIGHDAKKARDISSTHIYQELSKVLFGALTTVQEFLPDMLEKKAGAILFTTGLTAAYPLAMASGTSVATSALLSYVRVLNEDLKDENIYAGIVLIAGNVVTHEDHSAEPHSFLIPVFAEEVADKHWQLYSRQQEVELIAGDPRPIMKIAGARYSRSR